MKFLKDKPKIKKKVNSEGLHEFDGWSRCVQCHEMIHSSELSENLECCPKCNHHYRMGARARIALLADEGTFSEMFSHILPKDRLSFVDTESYEKRLKSAVKKSECNEALLAGTCKIEGFEVALAAFDFNFMGGSMGSVVGERLTLLFEYALEKKMPVIVVSSSGGARMQESIFSLMQMAKTSAALSRLHEAKIPFISVLTNPTSGGVTASFASLGDVIIAEPDALICFAGPRVVEQVIGQKLPPGAQKSEFLLKMGMIDGIVKREFLKKKIAAFLGYLIDSST